MLSTYLAAYPWLATAIVAAEIVVGLALGVLLARRRRAAWVLTGLALLAVLVATLAPTGRALELGCGFEWEVVLQAPEPLANVALFVPLALLLGIATRSPLLGGVAGVALSAAIEALQALAPAIGRSCTTEDWAANAVGAALGALLAAIVLLLDRRRSRRDARRRALTDAR